MPEKLPVELHEQLAKAAPKVEAAAPKTSNAVLTAFKTIFLPLLPGIVSALLVKANEKTLKIMRIVRDTLVNADLGDAPE